MSEMKRIETEITVGTSLQGYVDISFTDLVEMFGDPHYYERGKTDAEWYLRIDGVICTIYNYKDGKNYCGAEGDEIVDIRDWHIGGTSKESERKVKKYIKQYYMK